MRGRRRDKKESERGGGAGGREIRNEKFILREEGAIGRNATEAEKCEKD